uniref:Membrane insertase YidC/Oxa/ALB C-terminal domain-containing protein n=1 Tax=Trichuris muris TaxID=70415 RepID=A0A5S6QDP2_TRIMR
MIGRIGYRCLHTVSTSLTFRNYKGVTLCLPGAYKLPALLGTVAPCRQVSFLGKAQESVGSFPDISIADPKILSEIGPIPEPPTPLTPEQAAELDFILGSKLEYLGLGSYSPSGLVQLLLNYVHESFGLPWWAAIVVCTTSMRLLTSPVMIYSQRNSAAMTDFTKGMGKINEKLMDAKKRRDKFAEELLVMELQEYVQASKGARLYVRTFGISIVQGSLFLTYFIALRGMSYAPVLSMKEGGFGWIVDLTLPDPTWILPIYSAATVAVILELGLETGMATSSTTKFKWGLRVMPFLLFFFIKDYPSAMLLHWCVSNTFSLAMALLFQIPVVRRGLGVPPLERTLMTKLKELVLYGTSRRSGSGVKLESCPKQSLKERWRQFYSDRVVGSGPSESKVRDIDARNFSRAGKHSPPPTFPYNPRERFPAEFEVEKRGLKELFGFRKSSKGT